MDFDDYLWIPVIITVIVLVAIYLAVCMGSASVGQKHSLFTSDFTYTMKRMWARYKLDRWKKTRDDNKKIIIENQLEEPKIIKDAENYDSQMIWATNSEGSSVTVKFKRKFNRSAEVSLILTLNDGTVYRLPNQPDTMIFDGSSQTWSAGDLKLILLEPFTRWRIIFNGIMAKGSKNEPIDQNDSLHHVKINLIWIAAADPFRSPDDQSNILMANAIAFKSWNDAKWLDRITKSPTHDYDQYGTIVGIVSLPDSEQPIQLSLYGIRERKWGLEETAFTERSVAINGMTTDGTFYNIRVELNKIDSVQYQFGNVRTPNGDVMPIDWTNIDISKIASNKSNIPMTLSIQFSGGNKKFSSEISLEYSKSNLLRGGRPWNWESFIIPTTISINDKKGFGIIELWYNYNGDSRTISIPEVNQLQWIDLENITSDKICVSFQDKEASCPQFVGAKCASLSLLSSVKTNEYKVPNGFCLTINALTKQIQENKILADAIENIIKINIDPNQDKLKTACQTTTELFKNTNICDSVKYEIKKYFEDLCDVESGTEIYLAVRSSGIGEDSEELSAAGQNATILGCKTLNDVYDGVQQCWASLFTFQSVEYRRQHGQRVDCGMGVVVQKMIDSQSAGVVFTRHPTTGDPSCILITSNYGLGETVVSGQVDPDTIYIQRDLQNNLKIKTIDIGKKSHKMLLNKSENDLKDRMRISIDEDDSKKASLSNGECLRLGRIAIEQESLWGSPRDIEWTISEGIIYLVQARPITSLQSWSEIELLHELDSSIMSDEDMTTFANTGEVLPESISPLARTSMTKMMNDSISLNRGGVSPKYSLHSVVSSHYRIGLNVLNSFLKSVENNITVANKISDTAIYGHIVTDEKLHSIAKHRHGVLSFMAKSKLMLHFTRQLLNRKKYVKEAIKTADNFNIDLKNCKSSMEMYKIIDDSMPTIFTSSLLHTYTSTGSIYSQIIFLSVLIEGREEYTTENYTDIGSVLSSCTNVLTADIPISLMNIAISIKDANKIEEFINQDPKNGVNWLMENCSQAYELLKDFFKKHGHRGISEFDVMSDTWELDPVHIITTIQKTLSAPLLNSDKKVIETDLLSNFVSPVRSITKTLLKFVIPLCQNAVACREETKAALISTVHKNRMAYRQLSAQMMKEWLLPDLKLMFFMTHWELGKYIQTRDPGYINKAILRRRNFPSWNKLKFPEMNYGFPKSLETEIDSNNYSLTDGVTVRGTPVFSGTITGRACVVQNLSEIDKLKGGDILIAHSTDIGWSPYFPLLGGVITELGGLISHGAVVAREYGLPCIVGAQFATSKFQTGDTVFLNATNGFITKVVS